MGKIINDDKTSSNEFKQLLIPEDKKNYLLSTSTIKDSSSNSSNSLTNSSPISTTSHLSEYSQDNIKQLPQLPNENNDNINQTTKLDTKPSINIKENKLNKDYLLIINDLENLKNYQQKHTNSNSSPSTKSSSINSLNQLIKSSPSINSTNTKQINRSLTFLNDRNQKQQYLNDDKFSRLSKSKSTQNSNLNNNNFETNNLLQSYSAVFNDNLNDNRSNQNRFNIENKRMDNQLDNQTSKLNFKDAFYRKWFLNRFKNDSELNFDQQNSRSKKPKLINLKRYSSIDLNNEENLNDKNRQQRQSNCDNKNDQKNEEPGPSGVNKKYNLRSTDSKQQLTNPLHPFYLSTPYNCIDIDTWASTNNNHEASIIDDSFNDNTNNKNSNSSINDRNAQNSSSGSSNFSESNYSTLVCGTNLVSKKLTDKRNNQQQTNEQQQNKNNKKPILLPKLHNEYCTNTNSSHHHHHSNKNHSNENSSSCSSTRSNSSNISTSSIDDKIDQNKTNKDKSTNDLSGSLSSVSTESTTDSDKFCKICHLNGRDEDPLISPCRCSGTMQFIHCRCLMRWLEISKKKSRKPLQCELCQYQYQWHKKFKVGKFVFPKCSRKDKFLHCAFLISVIIMICCALSIIIFFKLQEPVYRVDPRRYDLTINEPITISLAMLFVFSFCMSLYAQVKARTTLYRLIMNFIYLNQQWYINEYEKNTKELAAGTAEIV